MIDINFANWLSGFTDGEGHFGLGWTGGGELIGRPQAVFQINLRADDEPILAQIKEHLGCGELRLLKQTRGSNPCIVFRVRRTEDLKNKVVVHFDKFPLRAKKQRDFKLWKEGVEILWSVLNQPKRIGPKRWTLSQRVEFAAITDQLKAIRKFA